MVMYRPASNEMRMQWFWNLFDRDRRWKRYVFILLKSDVKMKFSNNNLIVSFIFRRICLSVGIGTEAKRQSIYTYTTWRAVGFDTKGPGVEAHSAEAENEM